MKPVPIRVRLTAWYFIVLAVILSLFGLNAYVAMRNSAYEAVDEELRDRADGVRRLIERASEYGPENLQRELRQHSEVQASALLQVSDERGNWIFRSRAIGQYEIPKPQRIANTPSLFLAAGTPLRVLNIEVQAPDQSFIVQVAAPLDELYGALQRFETVLLVSIPVFLLCAAAGGYWMSARALSPVDQITRTARTISARSLSNRLVVPQTRDELQRLSETLNGMLERLEGAFRQITQFTADASHELRTPISLMRTEAEITLSQPRSAEEYREAFEEVYSELERTSELVEKLMLLARADYGAEVLQFETVDLAGIVRETCHQGKILAESKQVDFREQIPAEPLWIKGDTHALRRLFLILVDNAVKYTPSGGRVDVVLNSNDGSASVAVRDTGIGIGPEDLPHIFERFYRADKSRSEESGGVGLGLSIGYWIAEAHAGRIDVESSLGGGSVFRVRFPWAKDGHT